MAVKRRILREEIEEILDTASPEARTAPPQSLIPNESRTLEPSSRTDVPSKQGDYGDEDIDTETGYPSWSRTPTIGRTWPDVFYAFVKQPQTVPMLVLFGSFAICIKRIQKLGDIWLPLLIALLLSGIWFGGMAISKRRRSTQQRATGK
jgi:hypothetical protein